MIPLLKKYQPLLRNHASDDKLKLGLSILEKITDRRLHANPKECALSYLAFLCPLGKHRPEICLLPEIMELLEGLMKRHGLIEEVWNKLMP